MGHTRIVSNAATTYSTGSTINIRTASTRITNVRWRAQPGSLLNSYIQLFNTGSPNRSGSLNVHPPDRVIMCNATGVTALNQFREGNNEEFVGLFPVGFSYTVTTTSIGTVAPALTDCPEFVAIDYAEVTT